MGSILDIDICASNTHGSGLSQGREKDFGRGSICHRAYPMQ